MRDVAGRNAGPARAAGKYARDHNVDLRSVELDVTSEESAAQATDTILGEQQALDVLIHNAGHMVTGPAEAFTPDQLASLFDINVIGAQRLNRAVLPHMRKNGDGLVVWVGSSSTRGGTPPYLAPYFAAKAAMDALATSYALELSRFGIETSIIVPGSFTQGTNHFKNSGSPSDTAVVGEYETRYAGLMEQVSQKLAALQPPDADVSKVAEAIVAVIGTEKGRRPFRVHIDPSDDGSTVVDTVADLNRAAFLGRIDLSDLLHPSV
jgi:NAD(P)-dependent dehydrogenase (short-subunit alcohol dehydrogenase family)